MEEKENDILSKVDLQRKELERLVMIYGTSNKKVIECSNKLDDLINSYQYILNKKNFHID